MDDADPPERFRLFIAIELPEQVRNLIADAQQDFQKVLHQSRVIWTRPEQFHLTLKFLGYVESSRCASLIEALGTVCEGFPSLELRAADAGFFPSARAPRVAWAGVSDAADVLPTLHRAIEEATCPYSSEAPEPEGRFRGHVTLARIKDFARRDAEGLAAVAARLKDRVFGSWTANEVVLKRSQLSPRGAQYSNLAQTPLRGSKQRPVS